MLHQQPVFFVTHVPKCCGTSLHYAIRDGLALSDSSFYWPGRVSFTRKAGMSGIFWAHPSDFDYLVGHYPWGVHRLLRPWSHVARRKRLHIATLRDPIDQMISYYHYHLELGDRSPWSQFLSDNQDVVQFYLSAVPAQNLQTKAYAGLPFTNFWIPALKVLGERKLVRIAQNHLLKNYSYWIHHSFIESSVEHLSCGIGVPLKIARVGITATKSRPKLTDVSEDVIQRLSMINSLDIRLHQLLNPFFDRYCGSFADSSL
ncbi:hypothetical protein [Cyanobium sp. ULC082]